jgi:hypothetical protein
MGKRAIILLAVVVVIVLAFKFCGGKPDKNPPAEVKDKPLAIAENTGAFNQSFNALLTSYYSLKDAFVSSDVNKVNSAAAELIKSADGLKISEIKGDSTGMIKETAKQFAQTLSGSAKTMAGAADIEAKRHELETVTDALWSLTRTVQYDGQKVYYQYCPMAFNNKGAYWLSNTTEIRNPYFGDKMLKCGEVADSLDYSKR